jgi:hypothetical protein
MRPSRALALIALVAPLGACAATDSSPPVLEVTRPERGTLADDTTITVAGRVHDDAPGGLRVTVNGVVAAVAPDGSFQATLEATPGVTILETIAIDAAGNRDRDVRAVLAGTLAPADGVVADALGVHVGRSGLAAIGQVVGDTVTRMDLTAAVAPMNPVFYDPGCLGARVDVTRVQVADVDVAITPQIGALGIGVVIRDLEVRMHAAYRVACIGGTSTITVRARAARMSGDLGLDVRAGDLVAAVRDLDVVLEGFDLQAGGLPGAVLDLIEGVIGDRVAAALREVIRERAPGLVEQALADLTARSWTVPVLGRAVTVRARPTDVDLEPDGAFVAIATRITVAGGEGGAYLATPAPVSAALMDRAGAFGVALADDAINQLFAGLWASGALDQELPLERGSPLGLLLDARTRMVAVSLALPPTVSASAAGDLGVAIGDLVVRCLDEEGAELSRIAVSLATTLGIDRGAAGALRLRLGEPAVWAQILWQSDVLDHPLSADAIEELVRAVWSLLGPVADQALGSLPVPAIAGLSLEAPELASRGGFLVVEAGVAVAP